MEGETLQTFYTQLVLMPSVLHHTQYFLLALGCILLLITVICQILNQVGGVVWPNGTLLACWGKDGLGSYLLAFPSLPGAQFGQRISAWCRGSVAVSLHLLHPVLLFFRLFWEVWESSFGGTAGGFWVLRPGT